MLNVCAVQFWIIICSAIARYFCHDIPRKFPSQPTNESFEVNVRKKWQHCLTNCVQVSASLTCKWPKISCRYPTNTNVHRCTVYPKKYAHGFCFAVLCCGYTLTDFPISIRLTSLALWQSNDCPSASKAALMNMDKYFMWIHYERLHNHSKAKHNETVCIFLGIYCIGDII